MDQRNILLIGFCLVSFLLFQQWKQSQNPPIVHQTSINSSSTVPSGVSNARAGDVPQGSSGQDASIAPTTASASQVDLISVTTDKLDIKINPVGGDIVYADLKTYKKELNGKDPFVILQENQDDNFVFISQSGLIGKDGIDKKVGRPKYSSTKQNYNLTGDSLVVPLTYTNANGVIFTKIFTFTKNNFAVDIQYKINNKSDSAIELQLYAQLQQTIDSDHKTSMMMPTYRGPAYSTQKENYTKYKFDTLKERDLNEATVGGWVAMIQHYFVAAWIPNAKDNNTLYTGLNGGRGNIGFYSEINTILPNTEKVLGATFYVGPKVQKELSKISPHLNLVVDYGFLWWIASPLYKLLMFFQSIVSNWGVSIILITLTIRGIMYPLTKIQYTSMAKMRNLQPKMTSLKERFGEDKQKLGQAMMELYKKEKVNPMGGCFPIFLQMPIFIALYWMLLESVELRQAPFMLWIQDLSARDPFYILPLLMGASMWYMQKMQPMPPTMDPTQAKIMQFMPVLFTGMFLFFPSGLVLYWVVSNCVAITQQKIIYAQLAKRGL